MLLLQLLPLLFCLFCFVREAAVVISAAAAAVVGVGVGAFVDGPGFEGFLTGEAARAATPKRFISALSFSSCRDVQNRLLLRTKPRTKQAIATYKTTYKTGYCYVQNRLLLRT
jgi:hypothetical protein